LPYYLERGRPGDVQRVRVADRGAAMMPRQKPQPAKLPIMTAEERKKLLAVPITFNIIGPAKTRGGTCVADDDGHNRLHTPGTYVWYQMFRRTEND
jgi:hypothetical protein